MFLFCVVLVLRKEEYTRLNHVADLFYGDRLCLTAEPRERNRTTKTETGLQRKDYRVINRTTETDTSLQRQKHAHPAFEVFVSAFGVLVSAFSVLVSAFESVNLRACESASL